MKVIDKLKAKRLVIKDRINKFLVIASAIISVSVTQTATVFASTSAVTKPIDKLKDLFIAIIGAVGVIILAKNIMETAQAYQQQDSASMNSGIKGIVAGVMMAGIATVIKLLGF